MYQVLTLHLLELVYVLRVQLSERVVGQRFLVVDHLVGLSKLRLRRLKLSVE